MSNPIPNISDVDYLAVQEATRQATPSLHSNSSWLHIGSHSRIDTLITSEHASQNSVHSKPATEHETVSRMPDGPQAKWQYIMRHVSALPGLQKSEESDIQEQPAMPNEINTSLLQFEDMNNDDNNLPSLEECATVQDSAPERSETQPNYFTNPFESDNEYQPGITPMSRHTSTKLASQSNDSSVFVNDKYHTPLSASVQLNQVETKNLPLQKQEIGQQNTIDLDELAKDMPMAQLPKRNSEVQGNEPHTVPYFLLLLWYGIVVIGLN
jgi:hypothetical protein